MLTEINSNDGSHFTTEQTYEAHVDPNDTNNMYVELFGKQLKPMLQSREFKLVKENGESRYMIVTQDDTDVGNTIVTKQNNDGTISLTTVKGDETFIHNCTNPYHFFFIMGHQMSSPTWVKRNGLSDSN